jgi:polyisoprenoid-binding protein YceI
MTTLLTRLSLTATLLIAPLGASADMARYEIDREHTVVAFLVDHLGYAKALGRFTDISGHFMYDADTQELGAVSVSVGTGSVQTDNDARDSHVRRGDFLNTSEHPEMIFTADGGTAASDTAGTVSGTLTLLGTARPLDLDVTLNKVAVYPFGHSREAVGLSARGSLMRSDYGMDYGVANGLVGDQVDIIIEVEGIIAE